MSAEKCGKTLCRTLPQKVRHAALLPHSAALAAEGITAGQRLASAARASAALVTLGVLRRGANVVSAACRTRRKSPATGIRT